MQLAIVMPWRDQPDRRAGCFLTIQWYEANLPDVPIIYVDAPEYEPFNLGAARNRGVTQAEAQGYDTVVVTDADSFPSPAGLRAALDAVDDHKLHYPFDLCLYAGYDSPPGLANGGVMVITVEGWNRIGGQDERAVGWGSDDDTLCAAATALSGVVRHRGYATSLWHPACRDIGSERHAPNAALARKYWAAANDKKAMRAILAEEGRR